MAESAVTLKVSVSPAAKTCWVGALVRIGGRSVGSTYQPTTPPERALAV